MSEETEQTIGEWAAQSEHRCPFRCSAGYLIWEGDNVECNEQGTYYEVRRDGTRWFLADANDDEHPIEDIEDMTMRRRGEWWDE